MNARSVAVEPETALAARVRRWMQSVAAYPFVTSDVEVIETHISYVYLTDRFVFKLKKPVRYEFLDFSTAEARRQACCEEVRLNRRLARDIYLDVVPITVDDGHFHLGGDGKPVDWLVKMRRLPADRAMDELIRRGELTEAHVGQVAKTLANFYQQAPPVSLRCESYRQAIAQHVRANHLELSREVHQLPEPMIRRVWQAQQRVLQLWPDLLTTRVCDGRIVDGHGDLRPEHIYLAPSPTIIDCIEFNSDFRQIDVLDELCFLDMECVRLGAEWVGDKILAHYRTTCRDEPPEALRNFYRCYRACVRAKVCALRADQLTNHRADEAINEAAEYLHLADRYAADFARPLMLVVCGASGTGKSTVAAPLSQELGFVWLQTDAIRREMFGVSETPPQLNKGHYTTDKRQAVYNRMFDRADALLADGLSVILDGSFVSGEHRQAAAELARRRDVDLRFLWCDCPEPVASSRIQSRMAEGGSASEATSAVHHFHQASADWDFAGLPFTPIDTTQSLPDITERVFAAVRQAARCPE
ncbi:MAG: AAA family ATPase [Planctomycetales bacterium]|nr:AAA family ATPase [Planctomycetales bacterium]